MLSLFLRILGQGGHNSEIDSVGGSDFDLITIPG
jgi:hypothetical protein